jgi:hypothetical protein
LPFVAIDFHSIDPKCNFLPRKIHSIANDDTFVETGRQVVREKLHLVETTGTVEATKCRSIRKDRHFGSIDFHFASIDCPSVSIDCPFASIAGHLVAIAGQVASIAPTFAREEAPARGENAPSRAEARPCFASKRHPGLEK